MIDPNRVSEIYRNSLAGTKDDFDIAIIVEGIMAKYKFNAKKIEKYRKEIIEMLNQFPDEFYEDSGGGWSFLNFCNTKDGLWTGFQKIMEELLVLGIAIGKAKIEPSIREFWCALPGGVPYVRLER